MAGPHHKVRSQFRHVNDIAATIYEVLDITSTQVVDGVAQQPLNGKPMLNSFARPEAKVPTDREPNISSNMHNHCGVSIIFF